MVSDAGSTGAGREVESRLAAIVRDTHDAVIAKDLQGIITAWNMAAARMYGYTPEETVGRHISLLIPDDHAHEEEVILDRVRTGDRLETYETERIRKDGVRINVSLTASPIRDETGTIVGASVVARDITAEVRRRHAQAFFSKVAATFHASLDPEQTARTIAESGVPAFAELCVVDLLLPDGTIGDSTVAAADSAIAEGLANLRRSAPIDPGGSHPVAEVIRTGRPIVIRDLTDPGVRARVAQSEAHADFITAFEYNSAAVVPLVGRRGILGTLSFLHVDNDRRYDADDLELLLDLGARASMAIENARVHHERAKIARTLQRSLRPDRPERIPGANLAVVFEPVGEGVEVGGDFYDVFQVDGKWFVLIGDVVGKGPEAAALTGQIRHTVRALGLPGWTPASILTRVNSILYETQIEQQFASAQLLALRPQGDGRLGVELAGAGHPPAIAWGLEETRLIGGGTVLGVDPQARIATADFVLEPYEALILYTDGWLDAGPTPGHRTPQGLVELLWRDGDRDIDRALQRLRTDALERAGGILEDDMVILGLRVVGAARGEPAEAEVEIELAPTTEAGHEARIAILERLGGRLTEGVTHDLMTVVSELVNNAVDHGPGNAIRLRVAIGADGAIAGTVDDQGARPPALSVREWSPAGGGLGLQIVDYLTESWGVTDDGTAIAFRIAP